MAVTERLDFRVDRQIKSRIQRAAALRGQTVSSFAVSVLGREADSVLKEHTIISLNEAGTREFLERLDRDIEPNSNLRRAAERHKELIV